MKNIKELTKIANKLDSLGLTKEADVLDTYIRKSAGGFLGTFHGQFAPHELPPEIARLLKYLLTTSTAFNRYYDFKNQSIGIFIPSQDIGKAKALAAQIVNISQYIRNELDKDGGENFLRWYVNEIGTAYKDEIPEKLEELATKLDAESPVYKEASSHLRVTATFWRNSNSRYGNKSPSAPKIAPSDSGLVAETGTPGGTSAMTETKVYPKKPAVKMTWDKYIAKMGPKGEEVKKAWENLSSVDTSSTRRDSSFASFKSWYLERKGGEWSGMDKNADETIAAINNEIGRVNLWGNEVNKPTTTTGAFPR